MQFNIEVLSVSRSTQTGKTGKPYTMVEVAYKRDGKVEGKKLLEFNSKEVCKALDNAQLGTMFTITAEKEGDYWQWKSATTSSGASSSASSAAGPSTTSSTASKSPVKGEWETREERAARQVMIVKQSSLANAIATIKTDKVSSDPGSVIAVAQRYTDWVLSTGEAQSAVSSNLADMEDDIPL